MILVSADARAAAEEQRAVLATLTEDGALALAARPEPEAHEQVMHCEIWEYS